MAVETMAGTAAYLPRTATTPRTLRSRVATPGGATERGLTRSRSAACASVCRAAVDAVVEATQR